MHATDVRQFILRSDGGRSISGIFEEPSQFKKSGDKPLTKASCYMSGIYAGTGITRTAVFIFCWNCWKKIGLGVRGDTWGIAYCV